MRTGAMGLRHAPRTPVMFLEVILSLLLSHHLIQIVPIAVVKENHEKFHIGGDDETTGTQSVDLMAEAPQWGLDVPENGEIELLQSNLELLPGLVILGRKDAQPCSQQSACTGGTVVEDPAIPTNLQEMATLIHHTMLQSMHIIALTPNHVLEAGPLWVFSLQRLSFPATVILKRLQDGRLLGNHFSQHDDIHAKGRVTSNNRGDPVMGSTQSYVDGLKIG
ncbi:hypothetical protein DXG01_007064 [Tephrocybe rancida]|nr:hypothetical protein DXG01_007064 [Tephrocybe rancida]